MVKILSEYNTVLSLSRFQETEKRSRFISFIFHVSSEEEAQNYIKKIKSEYYDAKHHVYAYLLHDSGTEKFSDDGEPSGTAGYPIFGVIKSFGLSDVLIIVVRYFGGILLGTAGLRKMYVSGATGVVRKSSISKMKLCSIFRSVLDYKTYGKILTLIALYSGVVISADFSNVVTVNFYIDKEVTNDFLRKLDNLLGGNKNLELIEYKYMAVK